MISLNIIYIGADVDQ